MLHGSCLCGDVAFEVEGELQLPHACHCSFCQKFHGIGYGAYAMVDAASFRYTRGEDGIRSYRSSPDVERCFCSRCGSKLHTGTDRVGFPLGILDDANSPIPFEAHIFAASNPCWNDITDGAPCFDTWPPDFDLPVFPNPQRSSPVPGDAVTGSCLCDRVAYALPRPPAGMRHCHCSRCRKARSAPHATNAWTDLAGFRFTRGQDELSHYKVPEARFFMNVFCRTCGAPMPRVDESRDLVVIPAGSFDGDPGVRPVEHIYTGSQAGWFEITGTLPRRFERD